MSDAKARSINKKKKFVADGVFRAELHEFLTKTLNEYGYAGCTVKASQQTTIIKARVTGDKDRNSVPNRLKAELESLIQKRFGYDKGALIINFAAIQNKALCASAQAEALKADLLAGVSTRYCAQKIIANCIKGGGAHGCEIIISGKLRQQRAKSQKYKEGYLVSTGYPRQVFVDEAIRHVFLAQGMIGVKVKIMLPYAGEIRKPGVRGADTRFNSELPQKPLPDKVIFHPESEKTTEKDDFLPNQRGGRRPEQQTASD